MASDILNAQLVGSVPRPDEAAIQVPIELERAARSKLWTIILFFARWLLGALCCLNPLSSILVVGWSYRLVRRSVLKRWWKRSQVRSRHASFAKLTEADDSTMQFTDWPNWVVQQNGMRVFRRSGTESGSARNPTSVLVVPIHSLWLNFKTGVQGIFNTWVFTMPGCALWLFAWHAGWNNSFHKGYEQFWVGPLSGWMGVMLFMAAMLYVPMAQVRQAATGNWRAFYQFRLVRELIRRRWLACFGLAILYSAISLPVTILKTVPAFFPQISPRLGDLSAAEADWFLLRYFFFASLVVFPAYILLRLAAARIYASGMLSLIDAGTVGDVHLEQDERSVLQRLELLHHRPRTQRHILIRAVGWTGGRIARSAVFVAVLLAWFSFVAQIFIGEFLMYHPAVGWLNQPLVQLPWFYYWPS
jgi:hypothetical protein